MSSGFPTTLTLGPIDRVRLERCRCAPFHRPLHHAEIAAGLVRVTDERRRLQRQAQKERDRRSKQREQAFLAATIAFRHEPTAGRTIAEATLRKYARVMDEDVDTCTREIETHFHEIPADTLAQWLDWSDDIPRVARAEARR